LHKKNHDADANRSTAGSSEKFGKDMVMSINSKNAELRSKMDMRNFFVTLKIFGDAHHCFSLEERRS
jgi:hypothetical protein